MPELGEPLPDWTPPPWPGPMRLDGAWGWLEPLMPGHAPALFAANQASDAIWDYLPYGPFPDEASYAAWVTSAAGKPDPMFFTLFDRESGQPGGVLSFLRITPAAGSIEVGHICLAPRLQRTRAPSACRCRPPASKFAGSSQVSHAGRRQVQSPSVIANQAVSRLRPLTIMCCRNTPSNVKPKRSAARRERALAASHFHSNRR